MLLSTPQPGTFCGPLVLFRGGKGRQHTKTAWKESIHSVTLHYKLLVHNYFLLKYFFSPLKSIKVLSVFLISERLLCSKTQRISIQYSGTYRKPQNHSDGWPNQTVAQAHPQWLTSANLLQDHHFTHGGGGRKKKKKKQSPAGGMTPKRAFLVKLRINPHDQASSEGSSSSLLSIMIRLYHV